MADLDAADDKPPEKTPDVIKDAVEAIAALEVAESFLKMANLMRQYYVALRSEGFTVEQSMELVHGYQGSLLYNANSQEK